MASFNWKTGVAVALGLGAVAACVLFPPATLFISPATEFLAGLMPAFVGAFSGPVAFGLTLTSAFLAVAAVSKGVFEGAAKLSSWVASKCCSDTPRDEMVAHLPPRRSVTPDAAADVEPKCCGFLRKSVTNEARGPSESPAFK